MFPIDFSYHLKTLLLNVWYRIFHLQLGEARVLKRLAKIQDPLEKYQYLISLQDRNETLFYRILMENMSEIGSFLVSSRVPLCQRIKSHHCES
jgi:hypothetical protein